MKMVILLALLSVHTAVYAQEDTASVTYVPSEDIYLLQYNLLGVSYTDTLVPATRIDPAVVCSVTKDGQMFVFVYSVSLLPASQQYLSSFMVSHPAPIQNPAKPNVRWSQGEFAQYKIWDWSNSLMDPSGLWTPTTDVAPGGSISGFSFRSAGLPTIVKGYFEGNAPLLAFTAEPPQLLYDLRDTIDLFPYNTVVRRTLGPKDPPAPFNSLNFLDTITSYINQSRTLGWITNDQTKNKYTAIIDSAKANLQASPTRRGVAKAKLDSVLVNVYPDSSGGVITSEAYALLRFNVEYVLKKLREEDSTFAVENTSSSWDATATNNARHLAKTGSYLHEVFTSGGEIFYRRSGDGGSSWDQTHRINTTVGGNSHPCITTTQHVSIEIVWQRQTASSTYEVWHSYSQDEGASWSEPAMLPDATNVGVSSYQTEGPMPVIAEVYGEYNGLVVVYCSNEGLRYRTSEDEGATWQVPVNDIISGQYDDRVRFPSLAGGKSYVSLLYDYVDDDLGPYSRTFDGSSWSSEESVAEGTSSDDGSFSSVAKDKDNNPIAVWSGVVNTWTRSIVFRAGTPDNKWSKWFEAFGQSQFGPDWDAPSLTYYNRGVSGEFDIAIVNHTTADEIKLLRYTGYTEGIPPEPPSWAVGTLSESGVWPNITHDSYSSGVPFCSWTDQGSFPYQVSVVSPSELSSAMRGIPKMTSLSGFSQKRRAVVYHRTLRATLSLDFEPIRVVNANGDTSIVPFKTASLQDRSNIALSNMWDYLGSGVVSIPANARRLVFTKQFVTRGPAITKRKFLLRMLNANGVTIGQLDSSANSGTVSVDIRQFAGMNVIVRPQVTLSGIEPTALAIGVGDVYALPHSQPQRPKERKK